MQSRSCVGFEDDLGWAGVWRCADDDWVLILPGVGLRELGAVDDLAGRVGYVTLVVSRLAFGWGEAMLGVKADWWWSGGVLRSLRLGFW